MICHKYHGVVGYADDISLVVLSVYALNKMCDICLEFAYEYDLQFNPSKCQLIKYGSSTDCPFYTLLVLALTRLWIKICVMILYGV